MTDDERFLADIKKRDWKDELGRGVYADWLDGHDRNDEADRQRKWVQSKTWLMEFAKKHENEFSDYDVHYDSHDTADDTEIEVLNVDKTYDRLITFLTAHINYDPKNPPTLCHDRIETFCDYSDTLWTHFEIVTGLKAPTGSTRKKTPYFGCTC